LVGCEPADVGDGIGLSPPVAAVVEDAATMVEELVSGRGIP
jgi:hydrogenase maturation protease